MNPRETAVISPVSAWKKGVIMSLHTRKIFVVGLIILSLAGFAFSATHVPERPVKYSKVRIYITSKDDILSVTGAGVGLDEVANHGTYIDAVLNNQELAALK